MDPDIQGKIMALLTHNADLFAWTSADMPGIDPNFICHKLAIYKEAKPVSQRQRKLGDCKVYVQKCKACQEFGNLHQLPATALHSMQSAWPFAWWGMDILGPFPIAKNQLKFLLVGIDYFTKWIEAEPLAKITTANVQKFTWKKIICKYGLPQAITTDNGKQFIDKNFEQFLK
uniref:Pol polyprotein n=1 Tax=Cajanus cajan TaxID=3821 RepID=A0A151QXA9_CAJCA|nr:Pol polyprotein [Cajanus cajan]